MITNMLSTAHKQGKTGPGRRALISIFALVFVLAFSFAWITSGFAQGETGYVEFVRALGSDETGHSAPAGLAFSPKTKAFYILEAQPQGQALASVSKFDSLAGRLGSTQIAAQVENPANLTALQGRFQTKEFSADSNIPPEERRDAQNWMVGFTHIFRFQEDRHLLRLGYQFDVEDADGRNFKYLGHRALAGAQYTLPWGDTRLRYDFDLHHRNYRHAHALLPVVAPATRERVDTEMTHVVRVEQPLPWKGLCLPDAGDRPCLTLSAEYQAIISRSNLPVFSFNRNVYSLTLAWQY